MPLTCKFSPVLGKKREAYERGLGRRTPQARVSQDSWVAKSTEMPTEEEASVEEPSTTRRGPLRVS